MFLSSLIRVGRRAVVTPNRWCTCRTCPHCLSMRFFTSKSSGSDKKMNQESAKKEGQGKKEGGGESLTNDLVQEQQQTKHASEGELETKLAELKDVYLRTLADMENLRQRTRREVEAAKSFGHQAFAKDIIGVGEVLEMALASVRKTEVGKDIRKEKSQGDAESTPSVDHQMKDLVEGLSMTLEEFGKALAKHGITVIDPLHQKFDPNLHTALFEVPTEGVEPGVVVVVEKKGYLLHQRLLKSAAVGVSKAIDNEAKAN